MPRQQTLRLINKVAGLTEEGLSAAETAERLGISKRYVEVLRERSRDGEAKGKWRFVPDPGQVSGLSDEALELLTWSPDAYEEFFNRFAYPMKVYAHHRSVIEELFRKPISRRLLVNFPPRHGKTRLLTIWFPIWLLCRNRNTVILQISKTERVAKMFLRELAANLTTTKNAQELTKLFGTFAPEKTSTAGSLWRPNSGELVVTGRNDERAGELSIQSVGAGQQVQGLGFDWIIADDLINRDNSRTPANRDDIEEWFNEILLSRLTPAGKSIVIGTRVAPDDLYGRLAGKTRRRGEDAKVWRHVNYPAVRQGPELPGVPWADFENGFALWPEQWALNERDALKLPGGGDEEFTSLEDIYNHNGSDDFNRVYQQVPMAEGERLVNEEWITGVNTNGTGCRDPERAWGDRKKEKGEVRCIMLDPPQTSYGAMFCADVHPDRTGVDYGAVLLELVRAKMTVPAMRQNLERMAVTYKPDYLIMEINAAQRWFLQDPWATDWARRYKIRVIRHTTSQNKSDPQLGFETLSSDFEFGRIRIPDGTSESRRMFQPLVTEAVEYPYYRTQDTLMALWFSKIQARNLVANSSVNEQDESQPWAGIPSRLRQGFHWTRPREGVKV